MASSDKRLDELTAAIYMAGNDYFVVVRDPAGSKTTNTITKDLLFGNVDSDAVFTGNVSIDSAKYLIVNNMVIARKSTPVSNTDTVTGGSIWFDDNYIYVATANNTIKRVALSDFA